MARRLFTPDGNSCAIEQIRRPGVFVKYLIHLWIPMRSLLAALALMLAFNAYAEERILDLQTGQTLTRAQLIEQIAQQDVVLLGEIHDDTRHHALRGELLRELSGRRPLHVVAEQLESGKTYRKQDTLLAGLEQAGFDPRLWAWPAHETLFASIDAAGIPLAGGNIEIAQARGISRQGESAVPAPLLADIRQAPLSPAGRQQLDDDLLAGHCGFLKPAMLPNMRLTQRARDASMFEALQARPAGSLGVLIAGNGHVRMDYGVPVMLARHAPQTRWMSIGFIEQEDALEADLPALKTRYTHVWITPALKRGDPCAGFGQH